MLPLLVVAAGSPAMLESRVVLASIAACSVLMLVTCVGPGRLKTDNLYASAVDPISVPFCILALSDGGIGTLAALVGVTGLSQIAAGLRLSALRRLITPVVSTTLLFLSLISLVPVVVENLNQSRSEDERLGVVLCMAIALAVMIALNARRRESLKLWAAPIGLAAGIVVALVFGVYDVERVQEANTFGLPEGGWALLGPSGSGGFATSVFLTLLPSFLILGFAMLARTQGISLLTQFVSWRRLLSFDYREVQRAISRIGSGSIVSGVVGSLPLSAAPLGVRFISQTKCASRRVGAMAAVLLLVVAVFPKAWAAIIAAPRALLFVYLGFVLAPLLRRVIAAQKSTLRQARNAVLLGVPVLVGIIIDFGVDFPDTPVWQALTRHGLTIGSLVLVALAMAFNAMQHRRRIVTRLSVTSLGETRDFLADFANQRSWDAPTRERIEAVAEEAILVLTERVAADGSEDYRRLEISATAHHSTVALEFVSGSSDAANLEDRIALLTGLEEDMSEIEIERDVSLRMLRHYATEVRHQQYQEAEIITAEVSTAESRGD